MASDAPPVLAPPPGHPRFPLFDALRAVAVLSVVVFHSAVVSRVVVDRGWLEPLVHLDMGVTIFFLLSGFLLYRPHVYARRGGPPAPALGAYARNRALRILPAYWLALTVLALWPGLQWADSGNWWAYYGFVQIYPVTGEYTCLTCGIAPAWSLAVEVTFYAALPLIVLALDRATAGLDRRRWLWRELTVLAVLAAGSVAFKAWALSLGTGRRELFAFHTSLLGTFSWFAAGMALAGLSVAAAELPRRPGAVRFVEERSLWVWVAALILFVGACFTIFPSDPLSSDPAGAVAEQVVFGAVAALLLLPAAFAGSGRGVPRRILSLPVLGWLGLISYGIFLWHHPLLVELATGRGVESFPMLLTLTLAVTIACAAASYYVVERPLLRFKNRPARPPLKRAADADTGATSP